jgi:hypothetical protein
VCGGGIFKCFPYLLGICAHCYLFCLENSSTYRKVYCESIGSIMTRLQAMWPKNCGLIPCMDKTFFLLPKCPDWLWGPPLYYSLVSGGAFSRGKAAGYMDTWSRNSGWPHINFTFLWILDIRSLYHAFLQLPSRTYFTLLYFTLLYFTFLYFSHAIWRTLKNRFLTVGSNWFIGLKTGYCWCMELGIDDVNYSSTVLHISQNKNLRGTGSYMVNIWW